MCEAKSVINDLMDLNLNGSGKWIRQRRKKNIFQLRMKQRRTTM